MNPPVKITARARGELTAHLIRIGEHCGLTAHYVATTSMGITVVHLYDQDGQRVDAPEALNYLKALAKSVGVRFEDDLCGPPPLIVGSDGSMSVTRSLSMCGATWAVSVIVSEGDQS